MTEHDDRDLRDDRDLEGLRAHDPAANITAPAGFTDAVMARVGAGVGADAEAQIPDASTHASPEHPTSPQPAPAHTTTDHDPSAPIPLEAARSRRRWLITSAAAASALVLLAAGFGTGMLVGRHDQSTALSISTSTGDAMGATEGSRALPDAGSGVNSMAAGYGGRTVFTASGLGTEASTGQAYTLQPTSDLVSTLRVLAASLGIAGDPITQDGTTRIGDDTGQGKVAYVYADGSFSFSDGTKAWGGGCVVPPATSEGSATQDGPVSGAIQIAPCTNNDASASAPTISSADATARVNDLLKAAGWDASSWRLETMSSDGYVTVTGTLLIDGVESDQTLNAAFVGDDVANAWFSLASATSAGNYPVISPSDAVARLSDPRFGASGGMMPYAAVRADDVGAESGSATTGSAGSDAAPPARFEAGSPIPWPVSRVTITSAERVLTSVWPASATPAAPASEPTSPILVPAYRLSAADGSSWTVIAVADSALDFG